MAQIEGLQVNIQGNADGLKRAATEAANKLGDIAKSADEANKNIVSKLNQAADSVTTTYGGLAGNIASNLTSLINPATIAASAVTAIGAALLTYYQNLQSQSVSAEDAIKRHTDLIKELKTAYSDAVVGLEQYTKESENSFRNRIGASVYILQGQIQGLANTLTSQFGPVIQQVMNEAGSNTQSLLDVFVSLPRKFEPFRAAIDEFQRSVRAGSPDFVTFKNSIDAIGAAAAGVNPELNATANALAEAAKQGFQMQRGVDAGRAALSNLSPEAQKAAESLNKYNDAIKTLIGIAPAKVTDRYKADEAYLQAIQTAGGDENKIRQAVQARNDTLARIEAEEAEKVKPSAVKIDNSAEKLAREQESITKRLEMLTVGWGTEEEKLAAHLIKNQDLITQARAKEVIDDETHKILMLGAEEEYQKKMENLRMAGMNSALTATGEVFSAMGRVVQAGGKKNVRMAKMFGIAEAIIATMVAANKAMAVSATAGPAAAFAAWAAVAAKGLAAVAAIRSVNESGGGGGGGSAAGAGGGGGSGAASAAGGEAAGRGPGGNSVYINLQGQSFGRDQVRDLVKQIADFQKDGGQVVFA